MIDWKKNYLLALATAFLLWLGWPPIPYTAPLLLLAMVPLLVALEQLINSGVKNKGRTIFQLSFVTFFVWNTSSIYWVFNSLNAVMPSWTAAIISLIPFGLSPLLMAIAVRLYYSLRKRHSRIVSYLGLIVFWISYEFLHQTWDLAFPWMNLGNGFAQFHQLIQWYEFTGVYGGTLWVLLSNILIFEWYLQWKSGKKPDRKLAAIAVVIIGLPMIISVAMYTAYKEAENPANVVVVQPNVDPYGKFSFISQQEQLATLLELSAKAGQANTEYFIWPETALPQSVEERAIRNTASFEKLQEFLSKYKNGNIISGVSSYAIYDTLKTESANFDKGSNVFYDNFNAALQVENSQNVQFYHKSKLVPGVEQLPFASTLSFMKPLFAGFGGSAGSYGTQPEPSVFYAQSGLGVSPVICYESIWGEYVSRSVNKGAQFIAIITNDGWWGNTSGKDQHLQYAKLRAIETRRWVARSANTGISAFINQRGDIVKKTGWWVPAVIKADINLNDDITFYMRFRDFIALASSFIAIMLIIYITYTAIVLRVNKH